MSEQILWGESLHNPWGGRGCPALLFVCVVVGWGLLSLVCLAPGLGVSGKASTQWAKPLREAPGPGPWAMSLGQTLGPGRRQAPGPAPSPAWAAAKKEFKKKEDV